jgi:hypothetical protein
MRKGFVPTFSTFFLASIAWVKVALGKLRAGEAILEQAFADFDREGPYSFAMAPYQQKSVQTANWTPFLSGGGDALQLNRQNWILAG